MPKIIGIVGGGQLGRMLTEAARPLGFEVIVLDPVEDCPAVQAGAKQILGKLSDPDKIKELASQVDFLTWEIEHINTDVLEELLENGKSVNPSPSTLSIIKDKFKQKEFLQLADIPVAEFVAVSNKEDILKAAKKFEFPILLKSRTEAYDGRGNALVKTEEAIDIALEKLNGKELYVEKFVPFEKEIAVMAVRDKNGDVFAYPVTQTIHENNILHYTLSPAPIPEEHFRIAQDLAMEVLIHLDGAGVFGIEMFLTKSGEVLVNEIAPRVHNSGHYTIEGCKTSQFENHIRAITGMELGDCSMKVKAAVMVNILGERNGEANPQGLEEAEKLGDVFLHIYGKKETKVERKMGHLTVTGDDLDEVFKKAKLARSLISI